MIDPGGRQRFRQRQRRGINMAITPHEDLEFPAAIPALIHGNTKIPPGFHPADLSQLIFIGAGELRLEDVLRIEPEKVSLINVAKASHDDENPAARNGKGKYSFLVDFVPVAKWSFDVLPTDKREKDGNARQRQ